MKKRLFAGALAFCLGFTTFSYAAFAETGSENTEETIVWKSSDGDVFAQNVKDPIKVEFKIMF